MIIIQMKNLLNTVILWIVLTFCIYGNTYAQNEIKPLRIGDQCPDFTFSNILNSNLKTAKLSDFRGKLLILDFWATWCGACIASLPKMDSLQMRFGDKIHILAISNEPKKLVENFIKYNKRVKTLSLPYLAEDSILTKSFPRRLIPHVVWINGDGKVTHITMDTAVTYANIDKVLKGEAVSIATKSDRMETNSQLPLINGGLGPNVDFNPSLVKFHSFFSGRIDGLGGTNWPLQYINGEMIKPLPGYEGLIKKVMININITMFYRILFSLSNEAPDKPGSQLSRKYDGDYTEKMAARVSLEVKDSSFFYWPGMTKEQKDVRDNHKTTFCYELSVPLKDSLKIGEYMLTDLNRYFGSLLGITGGVEKRKVKCWVLHRRPGIDIPKSKDKKSSVEYSDSRDSIIFRSKKLNEWLRLILMFPMQDLTMPVINETGYNEPMDLEIPVTGDLLILGRALKRYGLAFKIEEREIDMIVIKNRK